ncbi:MAG: hypothetical protein QOC77_1585 [Thermoleophilaceae bacterium]|nr:hypothetical protein [Thermoleophilaceae bacterium]
MTELEIRGVRAGLLLDEPLLLSAAGSGLLWRARYRDDDSRVWRARADRAEDLLAALEPAKPSTGPIAALASLRPVRIDVRVEAPDGRAAGRAVTRRLVADGVRLRRWREEGLSATLHLPAADAPCATVVIDGTGGPRHGVTAALAGPLLASRGALVLGLGSGSIDTARERLTAVPGAGEPVLLTAADPLGVKPAHEPAGAEATGDAVVLPPGVGVRGEPEGGAADRAAAWDELLSRLVARSRATAA